MRTMLLFVLAVGSAAAQTPATTAAVPRLEYRETRWPNGRLRTAGTFLDDVRHGEYRTFREQGTPYELRHFDHGRESGLQQSWEADGAALTNP